MSSLVSLLNGIVDYAGLFPPAGLEMDQVICNYSEYQKTSQSWMLGRLVIPATRLSELESAAAEFLPQQPPAWRISALVPDVSDSDKYRSAIDAIVDFNRKHVDSQGGMAIVDAVETKADSLESIESVSSSMPDGIDVFFEIDHRSDPLELIAALAAHPRHRFAKIRTGGVTPDLIPSSGEVARFICRCAESKVGLKATAGLHHPIRSDFALTYEPDSVTGTMHGFINVFVAMILAFEHGLSEQEIHGVIEETEAGRFHFADDALGWKDWNVDNLAIERIRHAQAISFGSCSFVEPIQDLQQLGFGSSLAVVI